VRHQLNIKPNNTSIGLALSGRLDSLGDMLPRAAAMSVLRPNNTLPPCPGLSCFGLTGRISNHIHFTSSNSTTKQKETLFVLFLIFHFNKNAGKIENSAEKKRVFQSAGR
jgi:hypothetical protein